jgi:hypothetical protein
MNTMTKTISEIEMVEQLKLFPKKFLELPYEIRSSESHVKLLMENNPLIAPYLIKSFLDSVNRKSSLNILFVISLLEEAVEQNPSTFPQIMLSFVTKKMVDKVTKYMTDKETYIQTWIENIPLKWRDDTLMKEACFRIPHIMNSKDPYWKTPSGKELRSMDKHLSGKTNSFRRVSRSVYSLLRHRKESSSQTPKEFH